MGCGASHTRFERGAPGIPASTLAAAISVELKLFGSVVKHDLQIHYREQLVANIGHALVGRTGCLGERHNLARWQPERAEPYALIQHVSLRLLVAPKPCVLNVSAFDKRRPHTGQI